MTEAFFTMKCLLITTFQDVAFKWNPKSSDAVCILLTRSPEAVCVGGAAAASGNVKRVFYTVDRNLLSHVSSSTARFSDRVMLLR